MTVVAITAVERGQIHLLDRIKHEPRQVLLRQPLTQARRQQQLLLTITRDEVLRHHQMLLTAPDRPRFVRHPPWIGAVSPSLLPSTDAGARREPIARDQTLGPRSE